MEETNDALVGNVEAYATEVRSLVDFSRAEIDPACFEYKGGRKDKDKNERKGNYLFHDIVDGGAERTCKPPRNSRGHEEATRSMFHVLFTITI